MSSPPFISLDGLDGTGKSTQRDLLADWLRRRGFAVTTCADPGGTAVGDLLRDLLLHRRHEMSLTCEALLFMAGRAQLIAEVVDPALAAGRAVLTDRYLLATIVYQGYAGGLDVDQLRTVGRWAAGGREPDLTLVLDLPVEHALRRRKAEPDRVESRSLEYHQRVREGFRAEALRDPDRIRLIDARSSIAAVHEAICKEVDRVLAAGSRP